MTARRTARSNIGTRKFGVEIEFVGIDTRTAVRKLAAAGLSMREDVCYNHTDSTTTWKVVTDSSVYGNGGSGELVSPILSGEAGLEQVALACKTLSDAGATVNRTCGLHVHVDARRMPTKDIAEIFLRYGKCESKIDEIMPRSRRGNDNQFCHSVARTYHSADVVRRSGTVRDLCLHATGHERFKKLNLQSLTNHGSIEFRHHSGSVNGSKVTNWVRFCVNFVETTIAMAAAVTPVARRTRRAPAPAARNASSRTGRGLVNLQKIVRCLNSRAFSTPERLAEATGLSVTSIPVMISKLRTEYGFSIKKYRMGYTLNLGSANSLHDAYSRLGLNVSVPGGLPAVEEGNASSSSSVESNVNYSNPFFGLSAEIISYYEERVTDLAA